MREIIISGQQRVQLNRYLRGEIKATDLYGFLRARVNELPYDMVEKSTDHECIIYLSNNAKTDTDIHNTINWWDKFYKEYGIKRCNHWCYKNKQL